MLALRFPGTENQNDQSASPNDAAGSCNVGNGIVLHRDNDYDSSSEDENSHDEPTSPEDVTRACDAREPAELEDKSMEEMRKSLQKDLTKIVKKDVRILENKINSQVQENIEILRNELKEIREDMKRFKDETVQDLKTTNRELLKLFVSDLKSANEDLVNKSTAELREMLLSSSQPGNTQIFFTNPETQQIETNENTNEKFEKDESESCTSESLDTAEVQAMDESRSGKGLERFQKTSNLVVLFTRSTNPLKSKCNDNDGVLPHTSSCTDPTLPQDSILEESLISESASESLEEEPEASSHFTRFPTRPLISANLLDIEDESDDDFKETIVIPKTP